MRHVALLIALSWLGLILAACGQSTPAAVEPTVVAPPPSATPIVCSNSQTSIVLSVQPIGNDEVRVLGEGFNPGDRPLLIFTTQTEGQSDRIEGRASQPVNADGTFSHEEPLPRPKGTAQWRIAVVHERGVACISVQIP